MKGLRTAQGDFSMKLVILDGYTENPGDLSWEWIKEYCEYEVYDLTPVEKVIERAADADILVSNKTVITKEIIEALPKLKYIAVLATGYNTVDCQAAKERGIPVSNIPAYSTNGVAQLVFSFILEHCVNVALHNDSVKKGEWCETPHFCYWKADITELYGKTIGIIGFGKIGEAVSKIAEGFGMNVLINSRTPREADARFTDLDSLLEKSDIVTMHCPLTEQTKGMANKAFFAKMKKTALFINTSRGPVVNEYDLAEALNSGVIAGAGVDVLSNEPAKRDNPLLKCEKCLITPHIAWASSESRKRLMDIFRSNVEGFVSGSPVNVVNM